jgi:hypothetical protein
MQTILHLISKTTITYKQYCSGTYIHVLSETLISDKNPEFAVSVITFTKVFHTKFVGTFY